MDDEFRYMSDPDLVAECAKVGAIVGVMSERYKALGAEFSRRAGTVSGEIASLPAPLARMLAVEILLAEPEALGDDGLESALYVLREKLRTDRPGSLLKVAISAG